MDVHASRDGVIVLMHDAAVDRTTDGTGLLRDKTFDEIRALDAAYHWPYSGAEIPWRGRGVRVPSLDGVLSEFPEARYNIEIKQREPSIVPELCRVLRSHKAIDSAASRGMYVDAWTVNDEPTMARLVGLGIGGIITDRPDLLLKVLGREREPL